MYNTSKQQHVIIVTAVCTQSTFAATVEQAMGSVSRELGVTRTVSVVSHKHVVRSACLSSVRGTPGCKMYHGVEQWCRKLGRFKRLRSIL